jgi:hypothetical protein
LRIVASKGGQDQPNHKTVEFGTAGPASLGLRDQGGLSNCAILTSSSNRFACESISLFISAGRDNRARHCKALAMNALDPNQMTPAERLAEIADLLAAGFMRLRARKSSAFSRDTGESSLDFLPDQRGHAETRANRKA